MTSELAAIYGLFVQAAHHRIDRQCQVLSDANGATAANHCPVAHSGDTVKIKLLRSTVLVLWLVGPIMVQAASTAQWQRKAEAAVATIRGTIHVPGLQKPVRVRRDRWGIAHIYAGNSHDLFFAQGYVVAQDRLFQMELWKRSGQGRLAEILGPEAVPRDTNARRLLYRGDMEAEFRSYAPDTKAILEAFTAGINAYIAEVDNPAVGVCRSNFRSPASGRKPGIPWTV